jgi:hypothetical protein
LEIKAPKAQSGTGKREKKILNKGLENYEGVVRAK